MEGILKGLKPEKVFAFFEYLSSVPHGSGNTGPISELCVRFAEERGLRYFKDDVNNVIIYKPATPGCENAPTVIIQGHLDMVCTKTPDNDLDMSKEGPRLMTDGEWVWADRSSLGGDNAIGVATAMAILDDDTFAHPAIEALFTIDEETSLVGAGKLDVSNLEGKMLINLDSEEEGVFTVSCAGGMRCNSSIPVVREAVPEEEYSCFEVTVGGLMGGHSGADINRGRGNACKLLARFLYEAQDGLDVRLEDISGGDFDNVIPKVAHAKVDVKNEDCEAFLELAGKFDLIFRNELGTFDPGVLLTAEPSKSENDPASSDSTRTVLTALFATPDGIQKMSRTIANFVQTSLNLGVLRMSENFCAFSCSIRSSVYTEKYETLAKVRAIVEACGGTAAMRGEYPAWEYKKDSALREVALEAYRHVYGGEARVEGIHAGIECGVFAEKIEGLDAISFGPDLRDVHSVRERLNAPSTARMYELVKEMLKIIAGM